METILSRIQKAYHADRIERNHQDKKLFTSQKDFTLSKGDLLSIHELGDFKHLTPADLLREFEVYSLLAGIADDISDERFIEMLNLWEDSKSYEAKSNEMFGRSLVCKDLIKQRQDDWTKRLPVKTLVSRLSREAEPQLKQLLQLPNRTIREAVESELIRRNKNKVERKNKVKTFSITGGTDDITYDITPSARGLK